MNEERITEKALEDECGLLRLFGNLPDKMVITENILSKIFERNPITIKRAVSRGELPPSVKILGEQSWIVGNIREHLAKRMDEAKRKQVALYERIASLSS